MTADTMVAAAALFSASDPDVGDTVTLYDLWDDDASGHFVVAGAAKAAQQEIFVTAAELPTTGFAAGALGSVDHLWVRATDGTSWSAWQAFAVTAGASSSAAAQLASSMATFLAGSSASTTVGQAGDNQIAALDLLAAAQH